MTKLTKLTLILAAIAVTCSWQPVSAQDDFDDIYYNPDKEIKKEKPKAKKAQSGTSTPGIYRPSSTASGTMADYPSADSYAVGQGSRQIDVDTYNRRGMFAPIDTTQVSSEEPDNFTYTKRIERYHNPDIIGGSTDEELKDIYLYSQSQQPVNLNIYVVDTAPIWGNWWGPRYWNYINTNPWNWGFWRPYPYYSYAWGWDPYWDYNAYWNWAWGPGWTYPVWNYPYWSHPGWGWGPSWSWRPSTGPGSSRPHRPSYANTGNNRRPGIGTPQFTGNQRPGNMGRGRHSSVVGINSRPGAGGTSRPQTGVNSGIRPGTGSSSGSTVGTAGTTGGTTTRINRGRNGSNRQSREVRPASTESQTRVSRPAATPSRSSSYRSGGGSSRSSGGGGMSRGGGSRGRH